MAPTRRRTVWVTSWAKMGHDPHTTSEQAPRQKAGVVGDGPLHFAHLKLNCVALNFIGRPMAHHGPWVDWSSNLEVSQSRTYTRNHLRGPRSHPAKNSEWGSSSMFHVYIHWVHELYLKYRSVVSTVPWYLRMMKG